MLIPALATKRAEVESSTNVDNGKSMSDILAEAGGAVVSGAQKVGTSPVLPVEPATKLEQLLSWPPVDVHGNLLPPEKVKWNGGDNGNMTAAFFERDKKYKQAQDDSKLTPGEKAQLKAQREGDHAAMLAWVRTAEPARKAAYQADGFDLPPSLNGRPVTPAFVAGNKVKIASLIGARCVTCHGPDGNQADYALDSYEGLLVYMPPPVPPKAPTGGAVGGMNPAPPTVPPEPTPMKPVEPIPDAKDD